VKKKDKDKEADKHKSSSSASHHKSHKRSKKHKRSRSVSTDEYFKCCYQVDQVAYEYLLSLTKLSTTLFDFLKDSCMLHGMGYLLLKYVCFPEQSCAFLEIFP